MKKYRHVQLKHHGQVHTIAQCQECEWDNEDRLLASREATKHAKETGHVVSVEKGHSYHIHPIDHV